LQAGWSVTVRSSAQPMAVARPRAAACARAALSSEVEVAAVEAARPSVLPEEAAVAQLVSAAVEVPRQEVAEEQRASAVPQQEVEARSVSAAEVPRPAVVAEQRASADAGGGGAAGAGRAGGAAPGGGPFWGGCLPLPSSPGCACATTIDAVCACDGALANCIAVRAVVASSTRRRFVMMVSFPGRFYSRMVRRGRSTASQEAGLWRHQNAGSFLF
jgi:hypothetical protein